LSAVHTLDVRVPSAIHNNTLSNNQSDAHFETAQSVIQSSAKVAVALPPGMALKAASWWVIIRSAMQPAS
jgi:hypothetical protein